MGAGGTVARADLAVAHAAAPARGTWPVRLLGFASEIADQPPLIALCAATLGAGLVLRDRRLANAGGRMLAGELVATFLKSAIKANVDRTRPHVVVAGGAHQLEPGHSQASAFNSFPSGHTAGAVAVACAVARSYPPQAAPAALTAGAIAAIQIPRCKHYPSDIAAGAMIGLAADMMVEGAERLLVRAARGEAA